MFIYVIYLSPPLKIFEFVIISKCFYTDLEFIEIIYLSNIKPLMFTLPIF